MASISPRWIECKTFLVLTPRALAACRIKKGERAPPPWEAYRTAAQAEENHAFYMKMKKEFLKRREEGDREAKRASMPEPSLSLLRGREFDFESARRDGKGGKRSLNTTVVTGRSIADEPDSTIVFYRSHLGSLGNLLEMLPRERDAGCRKLVVQSDLSKTNLVSAPELSKRFEIEACGCAYHARRPFALYEDQDPAHTGYMLHLFRGLALHERLLDEYRRNRDNVLAVRDADSRALWDDILELAKRMAQRWSEATPLGTEVRYIITHFKKLTAYLESPHIDMSNNLQERLLRTEKLIEKSSMLRRTIEGRAVLEILRTILQTAVAAGVPTQEYLVDVMRADPEEVAAHPELFTPRGWSERQAERQPSPNDARDEDSPPVTSATVRRVNRSQIWPSPGGGRHPAIGGRARGPTPCGGPGPSPARPPPDPGARQDTGYAKSVRISWSRVCAPAFGGSALLPRHSVSPPPPFTA
jgi:hypothetical protein